jgi:hypothetical protein
VAWPRRVLEYISSRSRTASGDRYTISNPGVLLSSHGRVRFTNGTELEFDCASKSDIAKIVAFVLATGTLVTEGDSPRERYWVVDPNEKTLIVPQGLRFTLPKLSSSDRPDCPSDWEGQSRPRRSLVSRSFRSISHPGR